MPVRNGVPWFREISCFFFASKNLVIGNAFLNMCVISLYPIGIEYFMGFAVYLRQFVYDLYLIEHVIRVE